MTDAISRSAVLELIRDNVYVTGYAYAQLVSNVKGLPALDVAPVVRCVDCKHRCTFICPMYHTEICLDDLDGFDDYNVDNTDNDGFCHLGERWEGEEDD